MEKLRQIGGAAQEHGTEAVEKAGQGIGALAARMGKVALAATVVLWIAWFYMPALTVAVPGSRTFTSWEILSLDLNNQLNIVPGSNGLLNIIGLAALAAPFAAPFVRHPRGKFLYAMPLAFMILFAVAVLWNCNRAIGAAADYAKRNVTYVPQNPRWNQMQARSMQGIEDRLADALLKNISIGYGVFVIVIASLVIAAQVFRRRASFRAGGAA
jgi:hypothetical protein